MIHHHLWKCLNHFFNLWEEFEKSANQVNGLFFLFTQKALCKIARLIVLLVNLLLYMWWS
jgi:hypothetical protein